MRGFAESIEPQDYLLSLDIGDAFYHVLHP